jgi:tetratricopeptide (TPR) repeat protein
LYQQTGRTEESIDRFLAARTLQPGNHAATARLGHSYLLLNRLADARAEFERLAGVLPAVARNGLGEIALRERRFADAVDHFRAVLERAPQASAVHYSLAMAYRGLGRLEEARSHLQRRGPSGIRAADPLVDTLRALVRGERGLVNLGRLAYEAGQFQEAADAFSRALGDAPDSLPARVNLGLALSQLGNAAAAVEQFEAVLRSDDGNTAAHAGLGLVLARERRDRDAVDHLRVAFEHDPTGADVQRELVAVLLRLGQTDGAIEVLETVRLIDPDTEDTLVGLSILLADRARYKDAIVRLDEANRRFPERMQTATTLARLLASSPDRSLRDGQRALALAMAVYGSIASPAHAETIALALAELGRCGEAAEWMRRAISEAERVKDAAEIARLRGETAKYEAPSCRPPGQ